MSGIEGIVDSAFGNATDPPPSPQVLTSRIEFALTVDHLFLLIAASEVFLMQVGFALLETGTVRAKNAKNIMLKNTLDSCVGAFVWWGFGFPFAYGRPPNPFIGASSFFFADAYKSCDPKDSGYLCLHTIDPIDSSFAEWLFQWAFAATAATIVAGAVAERCTFVGYIIYTCFVTGFIYPVVVHWMWSPYGWLSASREPESPGAWVARGVVDFAGSGVVHMVGGCAALVGAIVLGPRTGRFDPPQRGSPDPWAPHNTTLVGLGTFLLWFGWYGFNPGSTLGLSGGKILLAEKVAVNTTLAASGGGIAATLACLCIHKYVDLPPVCNGILAGLVAVCSGCATSEPWACFVIGFTGALVQFAFAAGTKRLKIDDPLDAASVHFAAGFWGLIGGGLFGTRTNTDAAYSAHQPCGALYPGCGGQQLGVNLLGGLMITAWVGGTSLLLFGAMRLAGILRVSLEHEHEGLDKTHHGGAAYDMSTHATTIGQMASPAASGRSASSWGRRRGGGRGGGG